MPKYEVEVVFKVTADDPDDAVRRVRAVLDPISITLESGLSSYAILEDAATTVAD